MINIFGNKDYFIIAAPRSGTTWMSKMLNSHPDIFCVERRLFGNYADLIIDQDASEPRLRVTTDKYINSLFQHHGFEKFSKKIVLKSFIKNIQEQERKLSKKRIVVDKITPYLNTSNSVIKQVSTYFPKSKLVFLIRDGRDVLTSGVFHWFNKEPKGKELSDFENERRKMFIENADSKLERFFIDSEIEQWANEWVQPIRTINEAKKNHYVKVIKYEELLVKPEEVLFGVFDFFSAKNTPSILNNCLESGSFTNMASGRNRGEALQNAHVRKGISGDWKNYFTRKDAELFNKIAGDELIEFGYEKNKNWIEELR